jgi:predicted dehydrogenase
MGEQNPIQVGIVGCGYQGRLMAQAVGRTLAMRVTACADPDEDAAAEVAGLTGDASVHASAEDLLEKSDAEALVIATPHHVLQEIALAAIAAGKHVLAEKPVANNEKQAAAIEQALLGKNLCFMAGYSLRFFVAQEMVRKLLAAGAAGEIVAVTAGIGQGPLSGWFANPAFGGGALLYLGSHLVDEVLWFVQDEPVEVYASVSMCPENGADETSAFQLRFAGGAVAHCLVTQAAGQWFDFVHLYGREGRVSLVSSTWLQAEISVLSNTIPAYAEPATIRPLLTSEPLMMMLLPEMEEFAAAIREARPPAVTIGDARRVLRVLDAVVQSGNTDRPVMLG